MIDILIPVLGRPQNAPRVVDSIHRGTINPHTILFLCTPGDDVQIQAAKQTGAVVVLVEGDDHQYPRKINTGATWPLRANPHPWVFLGADDLNFHQGWDTAALAVHDQTGKLVIGTNDLGNPTVVQGKHATHSLVHRDYLAFGTIDEPGKLLCEQYSHNFVDTEFCATAKHRDQWAFAFGAHVEHEHWLWGKGKDDDTYGLGRETYREDSRTFARRKRLWR